MARENDWRASAATHRADTPPSGTPCPHQAASNSGASCQTSGASTRPIGTRQSGRAVRRSRSRLPGLPPREYRLRLRSPERSPHATVHAARARRSRESGSPAAVASTRPAVPRTPADRIAGASSRPPSGAAASARSHRHPSGAAAPGPEAGAAHSGHPLQPIAVAGSNHESGVQIVPVGAGLTGPQRGRRDILRRVAAPADAPTRPRPHRHAPVDRRGRHRCQDRRLLRPRVRRLHVLDTPESPRRWSSRAMRRAMSATTCATASRFSGGTA